MGNRIGSWAAWVAAALLGVGAVTSSALAQSKQKFGTVEIEQTLQAIVDTAVDGDPAVPAAALHIDSPLLGLYWEGAAGLADPLALRRRMKALFAGPRESLGSRTMMKHLREARVAMAADVPVRIASNTKTFTATAVLRLWEEGRLDLDDPIEKYIPGSLAELLRGDGYDTGSMTVRHLLTHTSGLFDHGSADIYHEKVGADPKHRWTRTEQVEGAVEWGDPHGAPGEFYTYSDTGYVLLGAIIQQVSGQPMAEAVRKLVGYRRLGMTSTWWETLEPKPEGVPDRAHQFYREFDTAEFDPSHDLYGGGGIATTMGDLARLTRALFTGGVFSDPATADAMLTTVEAARALPGAGKRALPPGAYRMGVWVAVVEGFTSYTNAGSFGTLATYVPELDLVITVTVNQKRNFGAPEELMRQTLILVSEYRTEILS